MKVELKELFKSQVELTIEVPVEEQQAHLEWAAEQLNTVKPIAGFRPGKAPYDAVKNQYGEMTILENALDKIVKQTYFKAITEKKLETVGAPKIDIEKSAPGNHIVFKATVALLPKITLADWKKIKIKRQTKETKDTEVETVLGDLRKMQAKEVLVYRPAQKPDKVLMDMNILLAGVPVEGGQAKDHSLYLDEDFYIPGLADKLIASKKNDILKFQLPFPENFYQKTLAGKKAAFKITIKGVYERTLAEVNDDFAKSLGQPSVEELKKAVRENLQMEARQKEEQRVEIEMLKKISDETQFSDIPEIIINEEKQKMFAELKGSLAERGMDFDNYLANVKKTAEQLAEDFTKGATERAKTALVIREIARGEKITVSPEEFKEELARVRETYKDTAEIDERLAAPEMQDYIAHMLLNRKVLHLLKEVILGTETEHCHDKNCTHNHGHDHKS